MWSHWSRETTPTNIYEKALRIRTHDVIWYKYETQTTDHDTLEPWQAAEVMI